jgi:membrane protease YdiL (CAAX protease family)
VRRSTALLGLLGLGLVLRVLVAGAAGPASTPAALIFAGILLAGAFAAWPPTDPSAGASVGGVRILSIGVLGFAGLAVGPLLTQGVRIQGRPHAGSPWIWVVTVSLVAISEEVLLRGALFAAVAEIGGSGWALGVTTLAFALIHAPLYGWRALPLDLAVGLWLGGLRLWTGHSGAPAAAHLLADLSAWWL